MKKTLLVSAMLASSFALSACGGGGGGETQTTSPNPVGASNPGTPGAGTQTSGGGDSGSVSASFSKGSAASYVLIGDGSQLAGNVTGYTQTADGAVTALDNTTLTGQTVVKDINGNASFAMGRWVQGTAAGTIGPIVLDGISPRAYHYALFNNLTALPTAGVYSCDSGKFTAPTYLEGGIVSSLDSSGVATGSATLSFSAAGANVAASISTSAGGQTGKVMGNSVLSTPTAFAFTGNYFAGGPGMGLTVSDGGGGKILVVVAYTDTQTNGNKYLGIAVFNCSQQ